MEIFYLDEYPEGRIRPFLTRIKNLRRLLDRINPDLVITALGPWGLWAYLASIGRKRVVVNTEHNTFERPDSAPMSKGQYFYKFVVNKLFPFVTVLAQREKDVIGNRIKNVVVLPNPLAFDIANEVPVKQKVIVAVGRLDGWHVKGFDVLIKAWNSIAAKYPEWKLELVGPGHQESIEFLKSLVEPQLLNTQMFFIGPSNQVQEYYSKAEILVSSSRYEGLGMVIFEAMSQGCACIACDYKGRQREIIRDESEGIICETDSVEALATSISYMIEHDQYRKAVQIKSLERAKFYSLDNIMNIWIDSLKRYLK